MYDIKLLNYLNEPVAHVSSAFLSGVIRLITAMPIGRTVDDVIAAGGRIEITNSVAPYNSVTELVDLGRDD